MIVIGYPPRPAPWRCAHCHEWVNADQMHHCPRYSGGRAKPGNTSLAAELRAVADQWIRDNGEYGAISHTYLHAAEIAERYESHSEDRAALVARAEAAQRELGNLLAVIFGDGGHRRAEIGDDAEAVRQAHERVAWDRQAVIELREIAARYKRIGEGNARCDDYHKGFRWGCKRAAAEIVAAIEQKGVTNDSS